MADLKIFSYKTQGLGGINKRVDIFESLKAKLMDIYCLQDTHFTKNDDFFLLEISWGVIVFSVVISPMQEE